MLPVTALLWCLALPAAGGAPSMEGPLIDDGGVIGADVKRTVEELLRAHRAESGVAVGIAVLEDPLGETLQQTAFAMRASFQAGFGRDAPQVLVVIVTSRRQMRIDVDQRLKELLTDEEVEAMTEGAAAFFRVSQWDPGVSALAERLVADTPRVPADPDLPRRVALAVGSGAVVFFGGLGVRSLVRRRRERTAQPPTA